MNKVWFYLLCCRAILFRGNYRLLDGWIVEFHKNVHMYTHSLKLSKGNETYDVYCEDTPSGFVGIWLFELKDKVTNATFRELLTVLRKWASQSGFQYYLCISQADYETNDAKGGSA